MLGLLIVLVIGSSSDEVARVRNHLLQAETQLRAADVSALDASQRSRRAALLDELARYRLRGQFPRNRDHDDATPYFIDDRGVRCAMAHLIESSGGVELVRRVTVTANNAYIADLATNEELGSWLLHNGISLGDAARIQPTYPRSVGGRCSSDAMCTSQLCIEAADDPELRYCSVPCGPAEPCPTVGEDAMYCEMREASSVCVFATPSPGSFGATCDPAASNCVHICLDRGAASVCTRSCEGDGECPMDFACEVDSSGYARRVCKPRADHGCSVTSSSGAGLCLLLLLVAVVTGRRRRASLTP